MGGLALKVGWVRLVEVQGSNLAAHHGLKKMVLLRLEISGIWLFDDLFLCVIYVWLMCYYMRKGALCVAMTGRIVFCYGVCMKIRGTKDNECLFWKFCNCGAVGVRLLLSCEVSYVFGVNDNFCSLI